MNWDIIKGKWNQAKGSIRSEWGKLTDDDVNLVAGDKDRLLGLLQERYGKTRDVVEAELNSWIQASGWSKDAGWSKDKDNEEPKHSAR